MTCKRDSIDSTLNTQNNSILKKKLGFHLETPERSFEILNHRSLNNLYYLLISLSFSGEKKKKLK